MRVTFLISGPSGDQRLWLSTGQCITVGRTQQADFVCPHDARMSSKHFRLECLDQFCRVRDLDSSNGTRVNGERIEEATLNHGDRLVAGSTEFRAVMENMSVEPSASLKQAPGHDVASRPIPRDTPLVTRADHRKPTVSSHQKVPPVAFSAPTTSATNVVPSAARETALLPRTASVGSRLQVIVRQGGPDERRIWLREEQRLVVGRSESADVAIRNDPQLHDRHFQIAFVDGAWRLKTFGDATCTVQNGRQVPAAGLTDGDVIIAGKTTFLIQIEGNAQPVAHSTWTTTSVPSGLVQITTPSNESAMSFSQAIARFSEAHGELVRLYILPPGAPAVGNLLAPTYLYDWLPEWVAKTRSPVIVTERTETTGLDAGTLDPRDIIACALVERDRLDESVRRLRAAARGQDRWHGRAQAEYLLSIVSYEQWPDFLANSAPQYARFLFDGVAGIVFPGEHGRTWIALGPSPFAESVGKMSEK